MNLKNYSRIIQLFFTTESFEDLSVRFSINLKIVFEPAHDKTYNKTFPTSENSDQPAHLRSLIRVFADRMCLRAIRRRINENLAILNGYAY